jgi:lipopolysaccharide assembly outer membrane protein LptD (OstA)
MSENDSLLLNLDSLKARFDREHGINTSKATQWNDSVAAAEDSIKKSQKKSALEAPVVYEAKDSVTFFMDTKNAYLYGNADVKYQKIDLKSENIRMNMDSSTVHAVGAVDTLGKKYGEPVFKDGSDEYEMEALS